MARLIDSYGRVKIMEGEESKIPYYVVLPPEFTEEEERVIRNARDFIGNYEKILHELERLPTSVEKEEYLKNFIREKIKDKGVSIEHMEDVVWSILDSLFLGYGKLGPLMRDEHLEEIMVNGVNTPVFVAHRRHGMCATNIVFESKEELLSLIHI